ncbi:hypothetical protein F4777DRAFT_580611 [Nemania sp. FL0916]|nr:hypothetical protein F4777DRAFT_580611 [Nemania sp. FL0916]
MGSVAVEPPTRVQKRAILYPPLVIISPSGQYAFFQVVLVDSQGLVVESPDALQGAVSVSPRTLEGAAASGRSQRDFAVFSDLTIHKSGTYTIQVNGYAMDYQSMPPTMVHTAAIGTRAIQVRSSRVPTEQPSSSEARLLSRLSQGGFPIP